MSEVFVERQQAFERLASIVVRLSGEGRATRSAGLKPALQFSEAGFDEKRLGFRSFRAFIEAAAQGGYVTLRPAPQGPDVDVLPATTAAAEAEVRSGRVRRDLWAAFVDWRLDWARVYDRETDRVGWLPTPERAFEDKQLASFRKAVAAEPQRYVSIEPISQNATLGWMTEFAAGLEDGPPKAALTTALTSGMPIRAFVLATREAGLHEHWNVVRGGHVRERMDSWAAEHDLTLDLWTEREALTERPFGARTAPRRSATAVGPLEDLRERVCAAVRQMSRGELLKLAIPLEYIIGDDGR